MVEPTDPFDVIVIGAGSSGAVVAARASENPALRILLVEAGPDPDTAELPEDLFDGRHNSTSDHDWRGSYTPVHGRSVAGFPRGKVVGGSSAVNTAIALRPAPEDLDGWADLGNSAWSFDACLPALKRLERDLDFGHHDHHGDAGPISIRRHTEAELTETHQAFLETALELGYPPCTDHNHPTACGAGSQPMNKLAGHLRVSTAVGYLSAARSRRNLTIMANTLTRRILTKNGATIGVEVETGGGTIVALRSNLVILCAGAIQTPPILWRSGIGPEMALSRIGVDLVADVPGVGANLDDHPATMLVARATSRHLTDRDLPLIQTILRYPVDPGPTRADLQIELLSFLEGPSFDGCFGLAAVLETTHGGVDGVTDSADGDPYRGSVVAESADPHSLPTVEANFGSDPRDITRLAGCLLDCVPFLTSGPLGDLVDEVIHPRLPLDREGALRLASRSLGSGFHPCGTARMGPASNTMTVVDERGRCHAVDGLVVADASIMPYVPRANTNLTTILIGERIGEWLRTEPEAYGL